MKHKNCKNLFFLGKGGTGKTSIAALTAMALAKRGIKVVLLSMDPAHNLFDVFEVKSSKNTVKIQENLIIEEIDINYWIKTYLKSIENKIAGSYQYLTSLSLEKHIETIRYSPGLEEYALQYAYEESFRKYKGYNLMIFDMPPTALALKFFNLPKLTIIWLEQLIDLRIKILEKKRIIDNVHRRKTKGSDDNILNQLNDMKNINENFIQNFQNISLSGIYIVLNEDQLSLAESINIHDMISKNEFNINGIVVNKYQNMVKKENISNKFCDLPVHYVPFAQNSLIGAKELALFLKNEAIQPYLDSILNTTQP